MKSSPSPKPGAYLIFGLSGTGKSTIAQRLCELGYIAIDTDNDKQLADWVDLATGQRVKDFPGFPLSEAWLRTHRWRWDAERFNELHRPSSHRAIFFCGGAENIEDFFSKFHLRFALYADNDTIEHRLTTRHSRRFNNTNPELKHLLGWNSAFVSTWRDRGVILINTNESLDHIVNQILIRAAR